MRSILVVIPYYKIFPPMNGGMLRCFHILVQLAKYFKVTVVTFEEVDSLKKAAETYPDLKNCEIISAASQPVVKDIFSILPARLGNALRFRFWKRSLKGPANDNFLRCYPIISPLLKKRSFHYVILENLSMLNIVPVIRRLAPASLIMYDAHNVDSSLMRQSGDGIEQSREYKWVWQHECRLHKLVDGVITCSTTDLEEFRQMNAGSLRGVVIPNGVEIRDDPDPADRKAHLIFCGSMAYLPNQQGLEWFCLRILPLIIQELPQVKLMVVGAGDPGKKLREIFNHPSILYFGQVDDVNSYYRKASVAVVPLLAGSGTRLKVLEAMSKKVPVVSTSKGAEGIAYTADKNIKIANDAINFAANTVALLKNCVMARSIEQEGYDLVTWHYDWNIVGERLHNFLIENTNK